MTPFSRQEIVDLLERLIRLTEQTLDWTERDEFAYTATTERFTFEIESQDRDGVHPFVFSVARHEGGEPVLEVNSAHEESDAITSSRLEQLFKLARRDALGIAKLASDIDEDLDNIDPQRRDYGPDEAPF